jgi:hypothetical protein
LILWEEPSKAWIGNDHPCGEADMEFFYAATTIIIGDGRIASFWYTPWLEGRKPKDIAPSILQFQRGKTHGEQRYAPRFLDLQYKDK